MIQTRIESEVGSLETVVVHTPGREIESMTPRTAGEVLYNDIIPISVVSDEHRTLKEFLSLVADVHEATDLIRVAVRNDEVRRRLVHDACRTPASRRRVTELLDLEPDLLVARLVEGLPARRDTLTETLAGREYDLPPLPNLYFMRDSSLVVRDQVVVGAMAHRVRTTEAMLLRAVFSSDDGGLTTSGVLFDGCDEQERATRTDGGHVSGTPEAGTLEGGQADVRLEGGDVLVVRRDLIVVGISERTSSEAVDVLASRLAGTADGPVTVIAAVLPRERSTIHLDMVFTLVDRDVALVYEPLVMGPQAIEVCTMRVTPAGARGARGAARGAADVRIEKQEGLLQALVREGVGVQPIPCGGRDPVIREREQWLSAGNVFAFAPGKVIGYDCNVATMEAFAAAGFEVHPAELFLRGEREVDDYRRLFVGLPGVNLARGGGGPRCMTLPVRRRPVD